MTQFVAATGGQQLQTLAGAPPRSNDSGWKRTTPSNVPCFLRPHTRGLTAGETKLLATVGPT